MTVAWGVVFALVRFYWAGAGIAGADTPAARVHIAFIALIGLAGAAVADGLVHGWAARLGRRRVVLLARVGGAVLLLGVAVGVLRWLADGGLGDDGVGGVVIPRTSSSARFCSLSSAGDPRTSCRSKRPDTDPRSVS